MSGKLSFSKIISVFLLTILLAVSAGNAQPVQAAGTVNSCSQAALMAAIGTGGVVNYSQACKSNPVVLTAEIVITADTTINANGYAVQISGGNAVRAFVVNAGATLTLNGLHITGGKSGGNPGGAILNHGTLIINNTTFTNNTSLGGNGGAIYNDGGVVQITNSSFSGNVTHGTGNSGQGGAMYSYNGTVTITNSTISGNGAQSNGGGGIYVRQKSGTAVMTIQNTILHNNQGNNCGVGAAVITNGGGNISYNSVADTSCVGFLNANPGLSSLGEYGSLMPVLALMSESSPAINLATANCPAADQRGVPRSNPNCDSGAFEYRYATQTAVELVTTPPVIYGDAVTFRATVTPTGVSGMVDFYVGPKGSMKIGSGLLNGGVATYTTTFLAAATYPIRAEYAGDAAYEISEGVLASGLTVEKAPLKITANNAVRLAGTDNPDFTFLVTGFRNGETASVFSTWPVCTTTATISSPLGQYPITCTGGAAQNYSFEYVPGVLTVTGHLLVVTPDNQTRPYGTDNPEFTYKITGFTGNDGIANLVALPSCSTTTMTTRTSPVSATPYEISCSGGLDETYSFDYKLGGLSITPLTATITADNQTRKYGAADPSFTYKITGFLDGESELMLTQVPVCVSSATAASPVGSAYTIDCIGAAAQNYLFHYVAGQLSITRTALAIAANNQSRPYGSANPVLTVTYTGFAEGDTAAVFTSPLSCQTPADLLSTVAGGPYPITCSGAAAVNYDISYVPAELTVSRAVLTVHADDKTKGYKEENPPLTYTISGFVNSELPSVVTGAPKLATTATLTSKGGTYPILITIGTLSADNYAFQFQDGVLVVIQYQVFLPIVVR